MKLSQAHITALQLSEQEGLSKIDPTSYLQCTAVFCIVVRCYIGTVRTACAQVLRTNNTVLSICSR